jgi:UDP:flavonoid glycosyltransferase YjiC (YdhE family)
MAKIVITTTGTMGDYLPYFSLGKALQDRGHQIILAIGESMFAKAEKLGLKVVACGGTFTQQEAQNDAQSWDQLKTGSISSLVYDPVMYQSMDLLFRREIPPVLKDLEIICHDADLLICNLQRLLIGALIQEKIAIPWVATSVMPFAQGEIIKTPHRNHDRPDPYLPTINQIREDFGLKSFSQEDWFKCNQLLHSDQRAMLASSRYFSPLNQLSQNFQQTGFWFYEDPAWQNWQPDPKLKEFMEQYPPALVFTFSSLPLKNAEEVLNTHIEGALQLGRRILIQQGWADFKADLLSKKYDPNSVMFRGFMPQDWLFSRAAAVINHGGIGTIARALRHDCTMLIEPYGNDQFFNAKQVLSLGVGRAMHPYKITPQGLAQVLETYVLSREYQENAHNLGAKIRAENGLETACNLIESWL